MSNALALVACELLGIEPRPSPAPMWATAVKRAWQFYPVTCVVRPGWSGCSSGSSLLA